MENIKLSFLGKEIPIHLGHNLLSSLEKNLMREEVFAVQDENVASIYKNIPWKCIVIPAGEIYKTRKTKAWIEDELIRLGASRSAILIAMGGGVICDLVGFVAATYMRGISLILLPTTALAQVDAAIGCKNGVNTLAMKNAIGTLYAPDSIWIDTQFIQTLSVSNLANGLAEMVKAAAVWDASYLDFLETSIDALLAKDLPLWHVAILRSVEIKKSIVDKDPLETGLRRILNFGHTTAHAIETLSEYRVEHGVAVLIGMAVAATLSKLSEKETQKFYTLCKKLAGSIETFDPELLYEQMLRDKKNLPGKVRFVLLEKIGAAKNSDQNYCEVVKKEEFLTAYGKTMRALRSDCRTFV